jgi:DNA polymerase
LLDRAIAQVGIDRNELFVTNAVKHFKFEPRGKQRPAQKAKCDEIERRPKDMERQIARPTLVIAPSARPNCGRGSRGRSGSAATGHQPCPDPAKRS